MSKKINKNIRSEVAIGIIAGIAIVLGGLIWQGNKNSQAYLNGRQYTSPVMKCDNIGASASGAIVFLGDSITALKDWSTSFKVPCIINAGISGNTTDDVISRLSEVISFKPQKLFLMIGVNDLLRGKDVSYIATNYEIILDRIKVQSPDTLIYIQSVLPINNDISKIGTIDSQKIITLNGELKLLTDGKKIFFVDLYPSFSGSDNKIQKEYTVDGVHLSSYGYAVWKNLISQYIKVY